MTDLQSTLESIDRALDDCDAGSLPPLDKTCLRQGCSNVVVDPVNPDYCSDRCRVAAAVADFASTALNIQLEPWQVGLLAATFRVPSQPPRTPWHHGRRSRCWCAGAGRQRLVHRGHGRHQQAHRTAARPAAGTAHPRT